MKRDALSRALSKIKTVRSWWRWLRCYECSADIKREPMWKIYVSRSYPDTSSWVHICMECRPNMDMVLQKYVNVPLYNQWKRKQKIDGPLELP